MNKTAFTAAVERLREVNDVVKTLDEAVRAEAFAILRPYVDGKDIDGKDEAGGKTEKQDVNVDEAVVADTSSAEAFIRSQPNIEKPAEAVKAIAAWWFSEYGSAPISAEDINRIAEGAGVTVPRRPDATLRGMRSDKKDVYRKSGRGAYLPTVPHGELFFKSQYSVTKGKKAPPSAETQ